MTISGHPSISFVSSFLSFQQWLTHSYHFTFRTVRSAARSIVTAPESLPQGLAPPELAGLSTTTVNITWMPPVLLHGRIVRYDVLSEALSGCAAVGMGGAGSSSGVLYVVSSFFPSFSCHSVSIADG